MSQKKQRYEEEKHCPICRRQTPGKLFEKHHLHPRGGKGRGKGNPIEMLCCDCHDFIHMHFANTDLRREYNTIEKLLEEERVQKWIGWACKQKFNVCHKKPKKKRG